MTYFDIIKDIDFDNSYNHTVDFVSRETQEIFFNNKVELSFTDFSWVKPNVEVKVPFNINNLQGLNYCRYTNTINGVSKTFFAFILSKEYVNTETTRLNLEVDVFQTYMFDYEIKESFIERQHEDRFILDGETIVPKFNKLPENLEVGRNFKLIDKKTLFDPSQSFSQNGSPRNIVWYYIIAKEKLGDTGEVAYINGVNTGVYIYFVPENFYAGQTLTPDMLSLETLSKKAIKINEIIENPEILSISASRIAPYGYNLTVTPDNDYSKWVINLNTSEIGGSINVVTSSLNGKNLYVLGRHTQPFRNIELGSFFENYILNINELVNIKNETKLLTSPFSFYKIRSNDDELIFNLENFTDTSPNKFMKFIKTFSTKNTTLLKLDNYLGENNLSSAKVLAQENEITLRQDAWLNYESNNKASLKSGLLSGITQTAVMTGLGLATGGIGLAVAGSTAISTGFQIFNQLQKQQDIKQQSDNVLNNIGDISLNVLKNELYLSLEKYEIFEEFKNIVFKYFMFYGYSSKRIEVPNLKSRYYYNYIKTIGVNVVGNLENNVLQKLKSIYDNGVTIWHYRDEETFKGVLNYNYENVEMTIHSTQGD